jgi:hypothetical protein
LGLTSPIPNEYKYSLTTYLFYGLKSML